jgi:hypothetical protein
MWQTTIDPQRGALCGCAVMPIARRPADEHGDKQAHLGRRRG